MTEPVAILILAVLGTLVAGFVVAFRRNLGGVGDFVRRTWGRVRLFFQGLTQLFEQGGRSACFGQGCWRRPSER